MLIKNLKLIFADAPSRRYLIRKYILHPIIILLSYILYFLYPFIPKKILRLKKPIFIIGCSRSGTTIFVDLFSRHKDIANWSEAGQVLDLNYFNPNNNHQKIKLRKIDYIRIKTLFSFFAYFKNKKRFVNKNPMNSLNIVYLRKIFPDCFFIHLVRDKKAVINSHLNMIKKDSFRKLYPYGLFVKPINWKKYSSLSPYQQFAHQREEIVNYIEGTLKNDKKYIKVRYEEFCLDTHKTLRRLDFFCGLNSNNRDFSKIPKSLKNQNYKYET